METYTAGTTNAYTEVTTTVEKEVVVDYKLVSI